MCFFAMLCCGAFGPIGSASEEQIQPKPVMTVYYEQRASAEALAALLVNAGAQCQLIDGNTPLPDKLPPCDLLITTPECRNLRMKGILLNLKGAARVVAMGEAGADLLSTKNLNIGAENAWHSRGTDPVNLKLDVLQGKYAQMFETPYSLEADLVKDSKVRIHPEGNKVDCAAVFDAGGFPEGIDGIGRENEMHHWFIARQNNYLLWGADSRADNLTEAGKKFFVNVCFYMARAQPEKLRFPPKRMIGLETVKELLKGRASRGKYFYELSNPQTLFVTLQWSKNVEMMLLVRDDAGLFRRKDGQSPLQIKFPKTGNIAPKKCRIEVGSFDLQENDPCPYQLTLSTKPDLPAFESVERTADTDDF
jgi:hypothetical protein